LLACANGVHFNQLNSHEEEKNQYFLDLSTPDFASKLVYIFMKLINK